MRRLLLAALLCCTPPLASSALADSAVPGSSQPPRIDRVLVRKGERRMYLLQGVDVVRSYRISLGLAPQGPKLRSGDYRTPEGNYRLTRRNPRSDFFLSIQIDYPNSEDIRQARRNRQNPGGSIMIHGLPNQMKHDPDYYVTHDWTNGCIALSNADMLEVWSLLPSRTPIDIVP